MIQITYEYKSAGGMPVVHRYICETTERAEEICNLCDKYGYKIVDVSKVWENE